jgi:predicted XRE-type DNA-binding protein
MENTHNSDNAETEEQAANMRTRSDLAWQIVDTIKDKGWTQEEAAKQAGIAVSRMNTLLSGDMDGFSADELRAIVEALQAKNEFIYLHDVSKNLHLLYQYSGVVANIRAFGGTAQDCIVFAGSDFKRDYGDSLTLRAVNELCIFYLAELMFDFMNTDRGHLISRVSGSPDFCDDVIRVFYTLSKIPSSDVAKAKKEADELNKKNAQLAGKVKSGYKLRPASVDKDLFIKWCRNSNIVVSKIIEFETWTTGWPLTNNYTLAVLKKWYKEAMPNVILSSGRPKRTK